MVKIATSILSIPKEDMNVEIPRIVKAGTDYIHLDVMDGKFVNNTTDGSYMLKKCLEKAPGVLIDTHLMVENPKDYLKEYEISDNITFHIEAIKKEEDIYEIIHQRHEQSKSVGISIKPDTPIELIQDYLELVDLVLIMTVEPGYGGQKLIPECLEKVKILRKEHPHLIIEVDGGVNIENVEMVKAAGANIIVAGTAIAKAEDKLKVINIMKSETV